MRGFLAFLAVLLCSSAILGQGGSTTTRYGVPLDRKTYPQSSPKEALRSVLGAIDAGRFDYLLAHLSDPTFVDDRVKRLYGGKFEEQVKDTRNRLDPFLIKQLRKFLDKGEWHISKEEATVVVEDLPDRRVYLIKMDDQWYLLHRFTPPRKGAP
jgi:hypothetical protein